MLARSSFIIFLAKIKVYTWTIVSGIFVVVWHYSSMNRVKHWTIERFLTIYTHWITKPSSRPLTMNICLWKFELDFQLCKFFLSLQIWINEWTKKSMIIIYGRRRFTINTNFPRRWCARKRMGKFLCVNMFGCFFNTIFY